MLFLDNWLLQTTHATYSILKIKSTHTNSTWLFLRMYSIKYLDKDKTEHQHSLVFELALTLKDRMRIKETNKWGGKRVEGEIKILQATFYWYSFSVNLGEITEQWSGLRESGWICVCVWSK